ncbi:MULTISPECIES: hypothetical protein [unclassified Caballeronia]|uniref:hypothetical protein n=1 Tax=unclassified Caballeronia TaxID=2646786 RepID=UPI0028559F71|nr:MULTISPECIES: hypothetical protein [unclassified Caballeronia]MDR5751295.1 hypothetical protein [Caballeronia sp. LZ024]MDR5844567.1 hypothetical protein [Caballeronia sp. LZ031]
MSFQYDADALHRTVKRLIDSGQAKSFEEAHEIAQRYQLQLELTAPIDFHEQVAALAVVILGRRAFLGGVAVSGCGDAPLHPSLGAARLLSDALRDAGANIANLEPSRPTISIGAAHKRTSPFHVRLLMAGWRAGTAPVDEGHPLDGDEPGYVMPLSAVAAAAFAVSQAFHHVSDGAPNSYEPGGISLWAPAAAAWDSPEFDGPPLQVLPSSVWLLGLGHLGQAFAWCLSLLPYPKLTQERPHILLQDVDRVGISTESTSVLTATKDNGRKKTRVVAEWLESRGFSTAIVERYFSGDTRKGQGEPSLLFCGVDNPEARRELENVGASLIIEAGLGSRHDDFQSVRMHSFPASRTTAQTWPQKPQREPVLGNFYVDLLEKGELGQCGVVELAGKAVGAAFVGAFAAALCVSEALRVLHGNAPSEVLDADMFALKCRTVVKNKYDFSALNPGFISV